MFLAEQPSIYVGGGHTGHIYLCNRARLIHREPAHDAAVTVLTQTKRGFVSGSLDGVRQSNNSQIEFVFARVLKRQHNL